MFLDVPQPSVAECARWAVALYVVSYEADQKAAIERDRRAGIRRYKNAPAARLRADLDTVLKAYPDGTVQRSAAAYVLARYGVDVERNVGRLYASARMDRKPFIFDNTEPLPEALADLWIVRRSPSALRHLAQMPSDAHISDEKGINLARVFHATPDPVLRAAAQTDGGWSCLARGIGEEGVPIPRGLRVREKALLAQLRRDVKR